VGVVVGEVGGASQERRARLRLAAVAANDELLMEDFGLKSPLTSMPLRSSAERMTRLISRRSPARDCPRNRAQPAPGTRRSCRRRSSSRFLLAGVRIDSTARRKRRREKPNDGPWWCSLGASRGGIPDPPQPSCEGSEASDPSADSTRYQSLHSWSLEGRCSPSQSDGSPTSVWR
jgi:hypothetical protein